MLRGIGREFIAATESDKEAEYYLACAITTAALGDKDGLEPLFYEHFTYQGLTERNDRLCDVFYWGLVEYCSYKPFNSSDQRRAPDEVLTKCF